MRVDVYKRQAYQRFRLAAGALFGVGALFCMAVLVLPAIVPAAARTVVLRLGRIEPVSYTHLARARYSPVASSGAALVLAAMPLFSIFLYTMR